MLTRPDQVGYATVWDGNKAVQCRRMPDRTLRCEAAGTRMQPSLDAVLTPERVAAIARLGWSLDPSFGLYVRTFPADMPTGMVAGHILDLLISGYAAAGDALEVGTDYVPDTRCPPRSGPSQNLAGLVNDAPSLRSVVVRTCAYVADPPPRRAETLEDLIAQHGDRVAAELQRLRVNAGRSVFVVLDAGIGYVQCAPKSPEALYCEAQSVQSWPALAAVLTPERLERLRAAGFAEPGRSPNHWRDYALDEWSDAAIAASLLTILREVYGFGGSASLKFIAQ
ncbi:TY-Chap domain-containing protein [Methylobacterium sp. A54F]